MHAPVGRQDSVVALMRARGHDVVQVDQPHPFTGADVVLLLRNAGWYRATCRELARTPPAQRPLVVVWHREPVLPPHAAGLPRPLINYRELAKIVLHDRRRTDVYSNSRWLRWLAQRSLPDVLVASTRGRQDYMLEQGLPARWAPLGHVPSLHGCGDLGLERDIDVLFIGGLEVPRRRRMVRALRRRGVDVMAVGGWHNPAYWGESRARFLNRARILINISRHRGDLADDRFVLGMANRALVISEPVYRPEPFEPGRHFVSATIDEMPAAIAHYISHEDERRTIVDEAHRFVIGHHTMDASVDMVLGYIAEARGG